MNKYRIIGINYTPFVACAVPTAFMVQKRVFYFLWKDIKAFTIRKDAEEYVRKHLK